MLNDFKLSSYFKINFTETLLLKRVLCITEWLGKFDKRKHSIQTLPFEIDDIRKEPYSNILGCLIDVVCRFQSMGPILRPLSVQSPSDLLNIAVPRVLFKGEGPLEPIRAISPEFVAYISYLLMHSLCPSRGGTGARAATAKLAYNIHKRAMVVNFLFGFLQPI